MSKRASKKSRSSTADVVSGEFSSQLAWARYLDYSEKIPPSISERGFEPGFGGDASIQATVELFGWSPFCMHTEQSVSLDLCSEFYAHLGANPGATSFTIRGKEVSFTAEAIRAFYQLPVISYDECGYRRIKANPPKLEEISSVICMSADAIVELAGSIKTSRRLLKPVVRVWLHFLNSSIMPNSHLSEIRVDRIYLLYCIMSHKPFNVYDLIYRSCLEAAAGTKIWFPNMVSRMCLAAGVEVQPREKLVKPGNPLNVTWIANIKAENDVPQSGAEHPAASGSRKGKGKASGVATSGEAAAITAQLASIMQYMARIERKMHKVHKSVYRAQQGEQVSPPSELEGPEWSAFPPEYGGGEATGGAGVMDDS